MAETTPKYIRLADSVVAIAQQLQAQLGDRYPTEGAVYREAIRRGLLLLALDAYDSGGGSYGGYTHEDLVDRLRRELLPAFAFLMEHNELPSIIEQAVLGKHGRWLPAVAPQKAMHLHADEAPTQAPSVIPIDASVLDSLLLGGDDDL